MTDPPDIVAQMREYYEARAPWHDEYMGYTSRAAMEALLAPIAERVRALLAGRDVLEIACGTGNWTQIVAGFARRVLATDISMAVLARAQEKECSPAMVSFRQADGYALNGIPVGFTGAFAADWWSHVPRSRLRPFLRGLHARLEPGAPVVFVDMLLRDHPDLTPTRRDAEGNGIVRRTLPDGRSYDVVKNYPSQGELLDRIAGLAEAAEYHQWNTLGRWLLAYRVPASSIRSGIGPAPGE